MTVKLAERLQHTEPFVISARDDIRRAAAVCAAVEAFQAAEQEWEQLARRLRDEESADDSKTDAEWSAAEAAYITAKARLLEVNLG